MKKYNLRIPENLQICINTQENNEGLIVKFNPNLWGIFKRQGEMYGYQLLDPNGGINERGQGTDFNLTYNQSCRLINKLIKKPGYGFGKTNEELTKKINKLINKIKQTYV